MANDGEEQRGRSFRSYERLGRLPGLSQVSPRFFLKVLALTGATLVAGQGLPGRCEGQAEASPLRSLAARHDGGAVGPTGARFSLTVPEGGLIQRFSVFLELEAGEPRSVKATLVSPAGTRILILDGERSMGVTPAGARGWYGADGHPSVESLAALADEPATGKWTLEIRCLGGGRLARWRLMGQLSDESSRGAYSTYSEYITEPSGGCRCDPFSLEVD